MALATEARTLQAAFKSLMRRPLARIEVPPGYRRFGVLEKSSYAQMVAMLLLLLAVEAPAVHLILGALMDDGALRAVVRALLLGSSVYLALWLIGDLRLLRETPGVLLADRALIIDMGTRANARVELNNILGVQPLVSDTSNLTVTPPQRFESPPFPDPTAAST